MHWIHIIKTPTAQLGRSGTWTVSIMVRIMSDLSDREVCTPITVRMSLFRLKEEAWDVCQIDNWKPKYFSEPLRLTAECGKGFNPEGVFVRVTANGSGSQTVGPNQIDRLDVPGTSSGLRDIISVYSAPLKRATESTYATSDLAFRWFKGALADDPFHADLQIWENTGETMERHMWDGGIAFAAYLHRLMKDSSMAYEFDSNRRNLKVIELGCGVGTVGIHLAQLIPNSKVLLTDLVGAKEMVERNISAAKPAPFSSLKFKELDWETIAMPDPVDMSFQTVDLLLVSDCFYNNSMVLHLIQTIKLLIAFNSDGTAPVVVAYKFRDPSERSFFEAMKEDFEITHEERLDLPDTDGHEEFVMVYVYRYRKRRLMFNPGMTRCPRAFWHWGINSFWREPGEPDEYQGHELEHDDLEDDESEEDQPDEVDTDGAPTSEDLVLPLTPQSYHG